jgi:N-acetylneuraminic acid mutarotase
MLLSLPAFGQSNDWAWMSGPQTPHLSQYGTLGTAAATNLPGNRTWAAGWTDITGNLWFFGGYGEDSLGRVGDLNDLWMFNPATKEWTWMGGSKTMGASAVYGTLGVPSVSNIPGGTESAVSWSDATGNVWLFGSANNELWKFNASTKQ